MIVIKNVCAKTLTLCLSIILLLNVSACHDKSRGAHTGVNPQAVNVIIDLASVAAEAGILLLTKKPSLASVVGGVTGVAAKYLVDEFKITCKVCGTETAFQNQVLADAEPNLIKCKNNSCKSAAYVIASCCEDRLKEAKESLPPTCLLMKEISDSNEVKLVWRTHNATSASLNDQMVDVQSSMIVNPSQTTTYILKVIGKYGKSEDKVTVDVQQIAAEEEIQETSQDQPLQPEPQPSVRTVYVQPPSPVIPAAPPTSPAISKITVYLNRVEVYEDGSLGGTDWSFSLLANNRNLLVIPKQSFHDGARNTVVFNSMPADTAIIGKDILIEVRGHNFDNEDNAIGTLNISLDTISGRTEKSLEVAVQHNPKKGDFIFYLTIARQ